MNAAYRVGRLIIVQLDLVGLGTRGHWSTAGSDNRYRLGGGRLLSLLGEGLGESLSRQQVESTEEVGVSELAGSLWLGTHEDQIDIGLGQCLVDQASFLREFGEGSVIHLTGIGLVAESAERHVDRLQILALVLSWGSAAFHLFGWG